MTVGDLIENPWEVLAPFAVGGPNGGRPRRVDVVPSNEQVDEWRRALDRKLRRLLHRERGITRKTIKRNKIGWDSVREGFTLPIYDESGELVNVSWRAPKGEDLRGLGRSKDRLAGRTAEGGGLPLYPFPLPRGKALLLCEGEWDALLARQHGLPAVTGLLGKQWHAAWDRYVVGRRVAVLYDVGAETEAQRTVERLQAAGAEEAWVAPLGLDAEGEDVGDWFVRRGRTADELIELIRDARRRA